MLGFGRRVQERRRGSAKNMFKKLRAADMNLGMLIIFRH